MTKTINKLSKFLAINFLVIYTPPPPPNRNVSQHIPPAEGSSLLVYEETPSDSYLQQLLTYADSVTNWISAEIVICDSIKVRGDITQESNRVSWEKEAAITVTAWALISHRTWTLMSVTGFPHMCFLFLL